MTVSIQIDIFNYVQSVVMMYLHHECSDVHAKLYHSLKVLLPRQLLRSRKKLEKLYEEEETRRQEISKDLCKCVSLKSVKRIHTYVDSENV